MSDQDIKEVIMPLMGEGITEATLIKWLKKPGDYVEKEEPLLEVSTDKVDTEIPAPYSGYLIKTYAQPQDAVLVNSVIAYIGKDKNSQAPESPPHATSTSLGGTKTETLKSNKDQTARRPMRVSKPNVPRPENSFNTPSSGQGLRSSPLVRKMARDFNLNLSAVLGSGLHGRITKYDVLNFMRQAAEQAGICLKEDLEYDVHSARLTTTLGDDGAEYLDGVKVTRKPMSKIRRLTADHMLQSVRRSPHVTTTFEMNMEKMVAFRNEYKAYFQKHYGFKLTFTHLLSYAAVQAIKKNMIVNCSVDGYDILEKEDINIGLAVAIDTGLIVPVIKKTQNMDLIALSQAAQELIVKAREHRLEPHDVKGGSFSITNPGLFGSLHSNPIINQPQVAILSIGAIVHRPIVDSNNNITSAPLIQIGLTFDHRVIDGEGGARYLADLKNIIENFDVQIS